MLLLYTPNIVWVSLLENLVLLHMNNKEEDKPAFLGSLISTFCCFLKFLKKA